MAKQENNQTEVQNEEVQPQQTPVTIVDERPLPKVLVTLIENSNRELQQVQQHLVNQINESATELMTLMSLSREDGWLLDIDNKRFVKVER